MRALKRARFVSNIRVIKELRNPEDLRYLLGSLPPWVSAPDWERGDAVQVLLGLMWPALNTFVCNIIRQELEERVQESSDFGHISFSRLSFGKHPPVIVGIKAVPLHGEDLLAMVLDVDVRWAGEPDVALRLTKLGGASLGLSDVHLAGVVRLVFSPITEDPPFLTRMTISLLARPYVDFSVRALGGPDLMSLPAISSWLHSVVLNLADMAIVWPKEVSVPLVPPSSSEAAEMAVAEAAALMPPLGVLVVRVVSADIAPRRSTFLGRLKLPSPRVSLVLPEATGVNGMEAGVMQAGLTAVKNKTLNPEYNTQFQFVVSHPSQHLRLLLSHKRMDLLGADMPLGVADLSMADILTDHAALEENKDQEHPRFGPQTDRHPLLNGPSLSTPFKPQIQRQTTLPASPVFMPDSPPQLHLPIVHSNNLLNGMVHSNTGSRTGGYSGYTSEEVPLGEDGYLTANSSPRKEVGGSTRSVSPARSYGSSGVAWATPSASLARPDDGFGGAPSATRRTRSVNWPPALHSKPGSTNNLTNLTTTSVTTTTITNTTATTTATRAHSEAQGLGLLLPTATAPIEPPHWTPPIAVHTPARNGATTTPAAGNNNNNNISHINGLSTHKLELADDGGSSSWLSRNGVWINVPTSTSMTMAGMVSNAAAAGTIESHVEEKPTTSGAATEEPSRGWFGMLQSFVVGTPEYEDLTDDEELESVGRVKLVVQWLPVEMNYDTASDNLSTDGNSTAAAEPARPSTAALVTAGSETSTSDVITAAPEPTPRLEGGSTDDIDDSPSSSQHGDSNRDSGSDTFSPMPTPRPAPGHPAKAGVLALRVAYTKVDYGESPNNPILALSVGANPVGSMASTSTAAANAIAPPNRMICMGCEAGGRPGLLHWGRVFHMAVWDPMGSRAVLELGDASSALKLSSYGAQLYALDACADFGADVTVEAAASIPLKDVLKKGVVRGTWRLREARGKIAGGVGLATGDEQQLDVGRVALVMAWFPLA